ncbi:hypothetical protein DFP72DRAFT_390269 [Ephemerocybe angulata]|uniref:EF-hand domain-containing protein n=1 Tax=Ephemerocybe angulata TaxID=980116 RepID=A0A8H6M3E4_9AGAR|nr:hypothetical protein DFP72DRAFT_390269 [Tulosesus angulatus]
MKLCASMEKLEASPLRVDRSGLVASTPLPPSPISPLVVNHEVYSTYPGLDPEWKAFLAADADQSGFIDATELQTALVNIPWNRPFDPKTVNMLINMFDLDHNEVISFNEFRGLLRYVRVSYNSWCSQSLVLNLCASLQEWREVFEAVDQDHSSSIDPRELRKALYHFGYKLSSSLVGMIHDKYTSDAGEPDEDRGISFDRFLRACLGVERSQKAFKKGHHPDHRGRVRFNEEQFMIAALNSIEV